MKSSLVWNKSMWTVCPRQDWAFKRVILTVSDTYIFNLNSCILNENQHFVCFVFCSTDHTVIENIFFAALTNMTEVNKPFKHHRET